MRLQKNSDYPKEFMWLNIYYATKMYIRLDTIFGRKNQNCVATSLQVILFLATAVLAWRRNEAMKNLQVTLGNLKHFLYMS
jgi:hypothetical protein